MRPHFVWVGGCECVCVRVDAVEIISKALREESGFMCECMAVIPVYIHTRIISKKHRSEINY